uniref:EGF-like domain-containing protein n=1 Tax=Anopheles atroparvus TaxID=41427 RepID=A0A182J250_ANOAO
MQPVPGSDSVLLLLLRDESAEPSVTSFSRSVMSANPQEGKAGLATMSLVLARRATASPLLMVVFPFLGLLPFDDDFYESRRDEDKGDLIVAGDTRRCTARYTGDFCDFPNPCHTAAGPRCQNGGSCETTFRDGIPSFSCRCPIGYTASLCEIPVKNACDSSPCNNGGNCKLKTLDDYTCVCATGYSGKHCDKQNLCASSPCRNGGTCTLSPNGHVKCYCPKGFRGLYCADDIDECLKNPCENSGKCMNTHGSYQTERDRVRVIGALRTPLIPVPPGKYTHGSSLPSASPAVPDAPAPPSITGIANRKNVRPALLRPSPGGGVVD